MALKAVCAPVLLLCLLPVQAAIEGYETFLVTGYNINFTHLAPKLDILRIVPAERTKSGMTEAYVRVNSKDKKTWRNYFEKENIQFEKAVNEIAAFKAADNSQNPKARTAAKTNSQAYGWDTYYSHSEINEYLDYVLKKNTNTVAVYNAAWSFEGRQIQYLRYSTSVFEEPQKPLIVITALVNAREWVTGAAAMYAIHKLVNNTDKNISEAADWLIMPVVNPDGYEYSRVEDRYWIKSRSTTHAKLPDCIGVNLNYNFEVDFGTNPKNADTCSNTFEGPSALSEPETRIIRDVIKQHKPRVELFINLRSQGNLVLYPWANNGTLPSNGLGLHLTGVQIATAMDRVADAESSTYIVGNAGQVLSTGTGSILDYARANGILYAFDISLPGFLVAPENIQQVVTEAWAGIAAAVNHVIFQLQ